MSKTLTMLKFLNKDLHEITERYTVKLNGTKYELHDDSFMEEEIEFITESFDEMRIFVQGFILGRNTKG